MLVCIVFDEVERGFQVERVQRAECVDVDSVGTTFGNWPMFEFL